jgi:hypothetical protein
MRKCRLAGAKMFLSALARQRRNGAMNKRIPFPHRSFTRRQFLYNSALATGATALGGAALAQSTARRVSPKRKT